jgi:hypothetical protein
MNGNEAAFPAHGWSSNPEVLERLKTQGGLTKREYFAAMAMQGMAAGDAWNQNFGVTNPEWLKNVAEVAVAAADALIAELNRSKAEEPKQ